MAEISASLVKELRERTGAGMMDCKKALTETGGDLEQAADWLRKKGLASAAKKASRIADKGLVGVLAEGGKGVVIEVNSETDFVARNDQFQNFVAKAAKEALAVGGDVEKLKTRSFPGGSRNAALAQQGDGPVEVAAGLLQRPLAIHEARAGALAQFLDQSGRDIRHARSLLLW